MQVDDSRCMPSQLEVIPKDLWIVLLFLCVDVVHDRIDYHAIHHFCAKIWIGWCKGVKVTASQVMSILEHLTSFLVTYLLEVVP